MRIEHVNLVVADIEPTLKFLRAAFPDWRLRGEGTGQWHGKPRRWVHFGSDDMYITLNDDGEGPNRDLTGHAPGLAHIGIETVDADSLIKRLREAGFEPSSTTDPDGAFRRRIYYIEPAGYEFEFVEYSSDIAAERNEYVPAGEYESYAVQ